MDEEAAVPQDDCQPSTSAAHEPTSGTSGTSGTSAAHKPKGSKGPAHKTPAPPATISRDSLYGQMKAAKQSSYGIANYFKAAFGILARSIGCTICVVLTAAVPMAMLVIGSLYLHDCPREPHITQYLIVAGVFGLVRIISSLVQRCIICCRDKDKKIDHYNPVDGTICLFLFAWSIAGSAWVYGIFRDFSTDDPSALDYCHPTLYYFTFWILTAGFIIMLLSCFCLCGTLLGLALTAK